MTADEAKREVNKAFEPAFANYIIEALTNGATCSDKREPSTDAVDREAVINIVMPYCPDDDRTVEKTGDLREMLDEIEDLPSVTPERPKGEWKPDGHGHIYCTNCNQTNVSMWKSAFCPSCGAEIKGGVTHERHNV